MFKVPVISIDGKPLMPTTILRARRWIKSKKATPFYKLNIFCVRLNVESSNINTQEIACGIDVGNKRNAYSLKTEKSTFVNIQDDSTAYIGLRMKNRKENRKQRRKRKTPYRKCRPNRSSRRKSGLPPSISAAWNRRLYIIKRLTKLFPIKTFIIEMTSVHPFKKNKYFSSIEIGKNQFLQKLLEFGIVKTLTGKQTADLRDKYKLIKSTHKLSDSFYSHCIDSWSMANSMVESKLDNIEVLRISKIKFHKRQLHFINPKNGERKRYGGTRSLGFKRGSIVKHKKHGIAIVGGSQRDNRITIYAFNRLTLSVHAKVKDCKFMSYDGNYIYRVK